MNQIIDERNHKIDRIKELGAALRDVVGHRYSLLIGISSLAASLLIISTFGKEFINIDISSLKIILTIIFICIPFSFFGLLVQTRLDHTSILKSMYRIANIEPEEIKYPIYLRFLASLPTILSFIIFLTILLIILGIWNIDVIKIISLVFAG